MINYGGSFALIAAEGGLRAAGTASNAGDGVNLPRVHIWEKKKKPTLHKTQRPFPAPTRSTCCYSQRKRQKNKNKTQRTRHGQTSARSAAPSSSNAGQDPQKRPVSSSEMFLFLNNPNFPVFRGCFGWRQPSNSPIHHARNGDGIARTGKASHQGLYFFPT